MFLYCLANNLKMLLHLKIHFNYNYIFYIELSLFKLCSLPFHLVVFWLRIATDSCLREQLKNSESIHGAEQLLLSYEITQN